MKFASNILKALAFILIVSWSVSTTIRQEKKEESPKLSRALSELDPTKKVNQNDFMTSVKYSLFKLTRGETYQIFTFADSNKDESIDFKEWDAFKSFFIIPFEKCDKNKDYMLDKAELESCWKEDERSKYVEFRKKYKGKEIESMISIVRTTSKLQINFADYLFLRKALFGWKMCHSSSKYIAKAHFTCALKTAVPTKYHVKLGFDNIFDIGIKLANDPTLSDLDFLSYLRVVYFSYVFSIFQQTNGTPYLDRTHFIKAIQEDRIPNKFTEDEVNSLYSLISSNALRPESQMNFETFSFFFNLHRLWTKYAASNQNSLSPEEVKKLLDDPFVPVNIIHSVDTSKTNFKDTEYYEASLYLQRKKVGEKDFFYSFKAVQDKKEGNTIPKNEEARQYFFTVMSGYDKSNWTKANYYSAFQLSNLFTSLISDNRYIVSTTTLLEQLPAHYDTVNPAINYKQRGNYPLYKTLPREIYLDLLSFLMLENFRTKVNLITINNNHNWITETQLKVVMKDYGMVKMHDELIDIAKKGYDSIKRRIYDPIEAIHILITVHTIANEKSRDSLIQNANKLAKNENLARKFPIGERRLAGSPIV